MASQYQSRHKKTAVSLTAQYPRSLTDEEQKDLREFVDSLTALLGSLEGRGGSTKGVVLGFFSKFVKEIGPVLTTSVESAAAGSIMTVVKIRGQKIGFSFSDN